MPKNRPAPDASAAAAATPTGGLAQGELHHILGYQLAQATITSSAVFQRLVGEPFELRPVEFTLLNLIGDNPGSSPARLAEALAVTAPNITMWIDRLEARGLVQRGRSATDRRAQRLDVTAAGRDLVQQTVQRLRQGEHEALAALSDGERLMLIELLHKVACCRGRVGAA